MRRACSLIVIAAIGCDAAGGVAPPAPISDADRGRHGPRFMPPHAVSNPVRRYGLYESERHRSMVAAAIELANGAMGGGVDFRLTPGWIPARAEGTRVPVYLVGLDRPGRFGISFVPRGERCIFVDDEALSSLQKAVLGQIPEQALCEDQELLALILLHEAGHIEHGDWGRVFPSQASSNTLNADETEGKKREIEADRFAAGQIKDGLRSPPTSRRVAAAARLENAVREVGFRLFLHRKKKDLESLRYEFDELLRREPGSSTGGTRSQSSESAAYLDAGASHPNLEYRLMRMHYEMFPTQGEKDILEQIENRRIDFRRKIPAPSR
jgi:hypothetical protein